jgi:PAS domain S-box-containing protein
LTTDKGEVSSLKEIEGRQVENGASQGQRGLYDAIGEGEETYLALFRNNPAVMYLVDPETARIVDVNIAACTFYGYSRNDMLRLKTSDINILSEEELRELGIRTSKGTGSYFNFRHRLADGSMRDVEVYSGPVNIKGQTLLYSTVHDITERKLAEARIEESERSLRAILSVSPIGTCRIKDGYLEWINDALCRITGYSFEDLTGRKPDFLFENSEDYLRAQAHLSGRGWFEAKYRRKDGVSIEVLMQSAEIDGSSSILAITDITHQSMAEREQARIGKLESLGALAGGIAHDFNNILTMILGNISLARMYMDTDMEKAREKLVNSEQAIARAKDLTQRLLTFSKGGAPIKKVIHIEEFLKDVCQFVLTGTPVICKFDFAQDLGSLEVDEGQLTQAIGHIVINGQQAMPGGGTIHIKAENIIIGPSMSNLSQGRYVRITITDEGVGIPEEYMNTIFDPYFTTKAKGSGLGLAVCYSVINKHKGHITVESTLGVGTSFHIYLPVFEGQETNRVDTGGAMSVSVGRILVMDDESSILDMVGDILAYHGYEVDLAYNGEEALSLYGKGKYDAVILDLTIPGGMGGKETMKALLKADPNVKAIVSSGYSSDPVMSNYKDHGFKDVIAKPYKIEELGEIVRRVIAGDN